MRAVSRDATSLPLHATHGRGLVGIGAGGGTVAAVPRPPRRPRAVQVPLDGLEIADPAPRARLAAPPPPAPGGRADAEAALQAGVAAAGERVRAEVAGDEEDPWAGSPYAWIRTLAPARRSRAAVLLAEAVLRAAGYDVGPRRGRGHHRVVAGRRLEVKLSTLWSAGTYTFQAIRSGEFDLAALVGVSPARVDVWVVPADVVLARVEPSDGAAGWLSFAAQAPPAWLAGYGGDLSALGDVLAGLVGPAGPPHGPAVPRPPG